MAARDPAGDQLDPGARDALRVEAARQRVGGRVGQVDRGRGDPVAAARGEQRLAAGELRLELLQHLGDGDRPEDDRRRAGLGGLRRALVEAVLGGIDERGEVEPGGPERDGLRAPRRADLGGGERALLGDVDAMRRGDRHARGARAQLDREPDPGGVLELLGERDRVELEHGAVPAVVRRAGARLRQRAGVVRLAVELRVCGRGGGGAVEPGVAQVGRRGGADAAVGEHDELGGRLHEVRDAVLPDREPPLPPDGRLAVAVEAGDRAARERGEVLQRRRHRGAEPTRCTKPGVGEGLGVDALRG